MTAPETIAAPLAVDAIAAPVALPLWQRGLRFGTGFGIVIGDENLQAVVVRSRPAGPVLVASNTVLNFRNRPAAEWGAELERFLVEAKETKLAATLLLPRSEVIFRLLNLPGVSDKDVPSAIELQIDTLHPYDAEVVWAWGRAAQGSVVVGLVRKDVLADYETLFAEAGIAIAAVTFSSAVIHSALRFWNAAPASLLLYTDGEAGRTEVYGESETRAVFSSEFSLPRERALAVGRAELRLSPSQEACSLAECLPVAEDSAGRSFSVLAYATAIAGSSGQGRNFVNLLPPERRASHNRLQYLLPVSLAGLLAASLLGVFVIFPAIEQTRYRAELDSAARALEPSIARVQALEKRISQTKTRTALLDELRRRPQADLDVLNELTHLLPADVWTTTIEIYPDSVLLAGEAAQATPLLKLLDASPLFENSEFSVSVTRNPQQIEQFRIKTMRRGRAGRTTP